MKTFHNRRVWIRNRSRKIMDPDTVCPGFGSGQYQTGSETLSMRTHFFFFVCLNIFKNSFILPFVRSMWCWYSAKNNKCSDRSMKVKVPTLLGNYDWRIDHPTDQRTDRLGYREVPLPISSMYRIFNNPGRLPWKLTVKMDPTDYVASISFCI